MIVRNDTFLVSEERRVELKTRVPESLRNEFKAQCAREGRPMGEVLIELVEEYIKNRQDEEKPQAQQ